MADNSHLRCHTSKFYANFERGKKRALLLFGARRAV